MVPKESETSTIRSSILEFVVLLSVVFLIRTFGFGLYQVPSGSMEVTMLVGERFFADKFSYLLSKPKRGDIIAFNEPGFVYSDNKFIALYQQYIWGPCNWTKRVIGIPGDHVRGVIEGSRFVIDTGSSNLVMEIPGNHVRGDIEQGNPVMYINNEKLKVSSYPGTLEGSVENSKVLFKGNHEKLIITASGSRMQGTIENGKPIVYINNEKLVIASPKNSVQGEMENGILHVYFNGKKVIDVDQEKFVIVSPERQVQGIIENSRPTIYVNNKKLSESYLNLYPLVYVWKSDPEKLLQQIETELAQLMNTRFLSPLEINAIKDRKLNTHITTRSYDPRVSFDQQLFYQIKQNLIIRNEDGTPRVEKSGTPIIRYGSPVVQNKNRYWSKSDEFSIELGSDEYWVMGDNRLGSKDSRMLGPIKESQIHGKIIFRIWSIDSDESWWIVDLIKHPIDFWYRIRWNRFFQLMS